MNAMLKPLYTALALIAATLPVGATCPVDLCVSVSGGSGSGQFAPYYIASNNHGTITQSSNALTSLRLVSESQHVTDRLSYSWGLEAIGGYSSTTTYRRYDSQAGQWTDNPQHPSRLWLGQMYGRIDYRSLFMQAGMKNAGSALLDDRLSSGDLTEGPNARPIPQVRAGFNDFQPIPFTNGWVEIQGEISYGWMTDGNWLENHTNRYIGNICTGRLYTYKRCYLRTKSSRPLTLTVGMQVSGVFGGTTRNYFQGKETITDNPHGIKEYWKMFIPTEGDEDYYLGSTLGSWDILLAYRLPGDNGIVKGYLQKPWETGSGIGFLNGFDGLWGLEYDAPSTGIVDGVVAEYIDFTNQSGPIHVDPYDMPGIDFPVHTDGNDNYYNNFYYNSYAYYGMSLGTPFIKSPIYNLDGYQGFTDNRIRGFHIGLRGTLSSRLTYRVLGGFRRSWGTHSVPRTEVADNTSAMIEGTYHTPMRKGSLDIKAAIAFDRGKLYGNTAGALITISYNTSFNIGGK